MIRGIRHLTIFRWWQNCSLPRASINHASQSPLFLWNFLAHVSPLLCGCCAKIRYMLAEEDESQPLELGNHPLFTQMDVLVHFSDNRVGWKEISRYESFPPVTTVFFKKKEKLEQKLISAWKVKVKWISKQELNKHWKEFSGSKKIQELK